MSVAKRIKIIRGRLSRPQFAKRLGVSQTAIQNYETLGRIPKGEVLQRMRTEFSVDINWLLTGEGEPYLYKNEEPDNVVPIDPDMGMAMEVVAEVEEEQGVTISSPQREELIKLIYEEALKHRAEERAEAKSKYRGLVDSFKSRMD